MASRRRRFLRVLVGIGVGGVAGCSGGDSPTGTGTAGTEPTDTSTTTTDAETTTTTTAPPPTGDWPTFRYDKRNTGYNRGTTGPSEEPSIVWEKEGIDEAHPTVVDDTIYIGGNNSVRALDAETGEQQWTYDVGNTVDAAPAVVDGTVVFNGWGGSIYALSADDGSEEWVRTTSNESDEGFDWTGMALETGSVTIVDGTVYKAGRVDRKDAFWALNLDSGETEFVIDSTTDDDNEWATDGGNEQFVSAPAIADDTAYLGSDEGYQYAIDLESGSVEWSRQPDAGRDGPIGHIRGSSSVVDGTVVFANLGLSTGKAVLYGLDAESGDTLWHYTIEEGDDDVRAATAAAHGVAVIGDTGGTVHAVELDDGTKRWSFDTGDSVYTAASADTERIYVGNYGGTVYAIAPDTGDVVWEFNDVPGAGDIDSAPVVADDKIYLNPRQSPLVALEA